MLQERASSMCVRCETFLRGIGGNVDGKCSVCT
jgi:hypothetical protein